MCRLGEQVTEEAESKGLGHEREVVEGEGEVEGEERNPKDKYLLQRQVPRCLLPLGRPH